MNNFLYVSHKVLIFSFKSSLHADIKLRPTEQFPCYYCFTILWGLFDLFENSVRMHFITEMHMYTTT